MPTYKDTELIIERLKFRAENLATLGLIKACSLAEIDRVIEIINDVPAVDPVHAAGACYCKECKHCFVYRPKETSPVQCSCFAQLGRVVPEDGFCHRGEKITFSTESGEENEEE